jgi:hypothetical protein
VGSHDRPWCNVLDEAVINFQPCVPHNIAYPLLDALQLEQKRRSNASAAVVIAQDYMKEKEDKVVALLEERTRNQRRISELEGQLLRCQWNGEAHYRRGVEAAIRVAEKVGNPGPADTVEAIKKLLEPQESHVARWQRLGYLVRWSEEEPRAYEVIPIEDKKFLDGNRKFAGPVVARLPTVQEVDRWVGENPR